MTEPDARPVRARLLGAHALQHRGAAAPLVQARARRAPRRCSVIAIIVNDRDVARAVRHHRHEPPPRLPARRRGGCTTGTIWDWATFLGTIGLFLSLLFLFIRFLPMISIFEMRDPGPGGGRAREAPSPRSPREGSRMNADVRARAARLRAARRSSSARTSSFVAAQRAREAGYRRMDAYTPFPIDGLSEALGLPRVEAPARSCSSAGSSAALTALVHAVVLVHRALPDERRRPAVRELAVVHPDHVRADGAVRGAAPPFSGCSG